MIMSSGETTAPNAPFASADRRGLSTTVAGSTYGLALAFVILRAFDIAQLAIAVPGSVGASQRPMLDAAVAFGFLTESVILCAIVLKQRRLDPRFVLVDVTTGCLVLLTSAWFTNPTERVSSKIGRAHV